jgi:hypothetical protein
MSLRRLFTGPAYGYPLKHTPRWGDVSADMGLLSVCFVNTQRMGLP